MKTQLLALATGSIVASGAFAEDSAGPRNVILFVGDGMSVATVTAARIFEGQQRGETGEENYLSFEEFGRLALGRRYNTGMEVTDSGGRMTALGTGGKTRAGVLSVAPESKRRGGSGEG